MVHRARGSPTIPCHLSERSPSKCPSSVMPGRVGGLEEGLRSHLLRVRGAGGVVSGREFVTDLGPEPPSSPTSVRPNSTGLAGQAPGSCKVFVDQSSSK